MKLIVIFGGLCIIAAVLVTSQYDPLGLFTAAEEETVAEAPAKPVVRNFRTDGDDHKMSLEAAMGRSDDAETAPQAKIGKAAPRRPVEEVAEEPEEYDALTTVLRAIGLAD
ncbi:MAG: hypothetical protein AAFT19_04130 [Pseudomonadota bacterium]